MTSPIASFSGISSGFNYRDLVDAIIAGERAPITRLEAEQAKLTARQQALTTYEGLLATLRTSAQGLRNGTAFDAVSVTSSVIAGSNPVANGSASPGAAPGTYEIRVQQLARAQKLGSAGQASATGALGLAGTFTVSGQEVNVAAGDSLEAIRDRINTLNSGPAATGVSASILQVSATEHRLVLTSGSTGAAGMTLADSSGTVLEQLGILDAGSPAPAAVLVAGRDAIFSIDGIQFTRSGNTVADAIAGVAVTLTGEDPTAVTRLNVERYADAATGSAKGFVDAYNAVVNFIKAQGTAGADGKNPALYGDPILRTMRSNLPMLMLQVIPGAAADMATAASVGLSLTRDGTMSLDSARFAEAFTSRHQDVRALFGERLAAAGADLTFVSGGGNLSGGTWNVEITAAATAASLVTTGFSGSYDAGATADTATITDTRSGRSVAVALTTGMSTADIAQAMQAAFDGEGLSLDAVVDGGQLRISHRETGSTAGVTVNVAGLGDGASELWSAGVAAHGTDVAGTIGGHAATGSGSLLVADQGSPAGGATIRYTGSATGSVGSVTLELGTGALIERLLDGFLAAGNGTIATQRSQIGLREGRNSDRITTLEGRLEYRRASLMRQFLAMETSIARLQSQSQSLLTFANQMSGASKQ